MPCWEKKKFLYDEVTSMLEEQPSVSDPSTGAPYAWCVHESLCLRLLDWARAEEPRSQRTLAAVNGACPACARLGFAPVFVCLVKTRLPFFFHLGFGKWQSGQILI